MKIPDLDKIYLGDSIEVMRGWPDSFVHCCVVSPPYWGLRDYGMEGQLGLEKTPQEYVEKMVAVFREVRRVLRDDGTLWLNMGDSYCADTKWGGSSGGKNEASGSERMRRTTGLKPKDLVGIPFTLAFALRADGWYLRQDIIWSKPNPMPESVTDRCTKAHEYLFLLSKSERYYFDQEAIAEQATTTTIERMQQDIDAQAGSHRVPGKTNGAMKAVLKKSGNKARKPASARGVPVDTDGRTDGAVAGSVPWEGATRNKRSVWTVTTVPCKETHFATFPPKLIEPCVLAGAPAGGGIVLDPFMGAGTTALVAARLNRHFLGIELNPEYIKIAEQRIAAEVAQGKMF